MLVPLLLFIFLSQVHADCFVDSFSPGKRSVLYLTTAVDDFHCKILCYLNAECLSYTFNGTVKGCAQHGPVDGHTCTLPTKEQLRSKNCPTISAPTSVDGAYRQNPSIDSTHMIPIKSNTGTGQVYSMPCGAGYRAIDLLMPDLSHKVVASTYFTNLAWDQELGAWYYEDITVRTYIRAAACFAVPLADAHALDATACSPLAVIDGLAGYGPPSAPFNRSWPCDDARASKVEHEATGGRQQTMTKGNAWINCVYGSWLWLTVHGGFEQTRGIMIIPLLLLATSALSLPHHQREANYRSLPADVGAPNGKMKLVFVNAVWRHGDRSPEQPLPGQGTDLFNEDDWKQGGGGYGELSPASGLYYLTGMIQQFTLGTRISKRYMQDFAFLTPRYRANEIYIRSTDYNRTLISAYSNLAGMYSGTGQDGTDLPSGLDGWPVGWVPVPVHTVVNKYDYAGNPDADCKRKAQVKQLILDSDEFAAYNADPQVKATLDWLSSHSQSSVTAQNAYWFQDTMMCESIHAVDLRGANADASKWYPWYFSGTVPDLTNSIVGRGLDFLDGLGNPLGVKGVDVSVEMPRMRAGETVGTIYDNFQGALYCYKNPDSDSCRKFFQKRKYFAISAHDKTLAALLTLLGPKKYVVPVGYPAFAASTFIELYVEEETGDEYFKVIYLATPSPDDDFKSVTNYVKGCPLTDEYCPLSVLRDIVDKYTPKPDMDTYCNTDVFDTA